MENKELVINYYIVNFSANHEKEYYDDTKNIENIKNLVFFRWKNSNYNMKKLLKDKEKYNLPHDFNCVEYSNLYKDLYISFGTNYSKLVNHYLVYGKKEGRYINTKRKSNIDKGIYDGKNIIMLWTPKAGCTAAIKCMFEHMGILDDALEYDDFIHKYRTDKFYKKYGRTNDSLLKNKFCFKVVRNPYARAISSYFHLQDCYLEDNNDKCESVCSLSFLDYLRILKNNNMRFVFDGVENIYATFHSMTQYDENEEEYLNCFIKIEKGEKEINEKINNILNANLRIHDKTSSHYNKRTLDRIICYDISKKSLREINENGIPKKYKLFYNNNEAKKLAEELYCLDIEKYSYSFDEDF
jgi:hypothetical protein